MKYKLELEFKNKPQCFMCGLWNDNDNMCLIIHKGCPEEGCRKDCPLVEEVST